VKTAYSYIRFSSPKQAKGTSEERQRATADWCQRNGYQLDDRLKLRDLGTSGYRGKHAHEGALSVFLQAVEQSKVPRGAALVVEAMDRLSREEVTLACQRFLSLISDGITIVTLTPEQVFTRASLARDPAPLFLAVAQMAAAHDYSRRLAERISFAWEKRRKKMRAGEAIFNRKAPGWLVREGEKWVKLPERVKVVQRAVALAIEGDGPYSIAARFNREGIPPLTNRKNFERMKPVKEWEWTTVRHLLTTRALVGEFQPHTFREFDGRTGKPATEDTDPRDKVRRLVPDGEPIKNYYPKIISETAYWRVQTQIQKRAIGVRGRTGRNVANLFGRILTSATDGSTLRMSQKHKGGHCNLVSARAVRGAAPYCPFPYAAFEEAFLKWVFEVGWQVPQQPTNQTNPCVDIEDRLVVAQAKRDKAKQLIERTTDLDAISSLLESEANYAVETKRLERELAAARAAGALPSTTEMQQEIGATAKRLARLKGGELHEARERLRSLIQGLCKGIRLTVWGSRQKRYAVAEVVFVDRQPDPDEGEWPDPVLRFGAMKARGKPAVSTGLWLPLKCSDTKIRNIAAAMLDCLAAGGTPDEVVAALKRVLGKGPTGEELARLANRAPAPAERDYY
jgi:DNA invertase Pin-like site-specific DNA recombinase